MKTRILIDRGVPFEYMFVAFVTVLLAMIMYNLLVLLKGRGLKTWIKKIIRKITNIILYPFVKIFSFIKKVLSPLVTKTKALFRKVLSPFITFASFIKRKMTSFVKLIGKGLRKFIYILFFPIIWPINFIKKKRSSKKESKEHIKYPVYSLNNDIEVADDEREEEEEEEEEDLSAESTKETDNDKKTESTPASNTEENSTITETEKSNSTLKLKQTSKKLFSPFRRFGSFVSRNRFYLINLLLIILLSIIGFDMQGASGVRSIYPDHDAHLTSFEKPITIEFDRPFNEGIIQPYIHPEIDGEWEAEAVFDWLPWSKRRLKFYPEESMFYGKVFIYYAEITDIFDISDKWEYGIDAMSVPIPEVLDVSPKHKSVDFAADGVITVHLDVPADRTSEWTLQSEPPVEYSINYNKGSLIEISFDTKLTQSTKYKFTIIKTPVRYNIKTKEIIERAEPETIKELTVTTVKEPLIETFDPTGSEILIDKIIKIVFDAEMEKDIIEESFSITPEITGVISWEDNRTFVFTPDKNLTKDTNYEISFPAGLKSKAGGFTETEIKHSFKSIGPVKAIGYGPSSYSALVGSNVTVTFNQAVNHASAQSHFSISPNIAGTFSWSGNKMIFNPTGNLNYTTTYTVKVTAGVKTVHGLDSKTSFSHTFKTQVDKFILGVPVYYQKLRFSCNLVAARMALAKKGAYISTSQAYSRIAKDSTPYNATNNTFGNPYAGYTGDLYGVTKGYGTYWGPLANMIRGFRSAGVKTGWNRTAALQEVQKGNPVIIWAHNGYSGSGANISWKTPSGQSIYAIQGMHSYVLVGWEGDISNPTYIYLNDPNRGRWKIRTSYFDGLWSYFNRSAVVVY